MVTTFGAADRAKRVASEPLRPILPLWGAVLAAAAAGVLMNLAFPGAAVWLAAFPATALLLVALIGRRAGGALLVGFVYGATFFLLLVSWTSRYLGPIPWLALGLLEGLLTAICVIPIALAYRWIPTQVRNGAGQMLLLSSCIAALWTGREVLLGSWPYGGFPWARIGMTQSSTAAAELSSWVGVSGLGFVMVMLVAVALEMLRARVWRRELAAVASSRNPRWIIIAPVILLALLTVLPAFPTTVSGSMRVAAVQGNGPTGYFDEREPFAVIQAQVDATKPLYGENIDLLVWPEGGIEADPFENAGLARMLSRVVSQTGAPLLANAATSVADRYYNTSFLWNEGVGMPQRSEVPTHSKRHPVPFGEYVPDREFFAAIVPDLIGLIQREYTAGTDTPVVAVGGTPVGLAICFDVIYDDVIHAGIFGGAEVLIFQTNNADFRGTDENLQQLSFARMRAIETGRSVVNISTVGTSQIIRSNGSTMAAIDADRPGALLEDVELRTGATAGVFLGPYVEAIALWGGLLLTAGAGMLLRVRQRSTKDSEND